MTSLVWYPAKDVTPAETLSIGDPKAPLFNAGIVATRAPFADNVRRPLVILSHGTGGSGLQMAWLGVELARAGFIAVAINHHGNTGAEPPYDPRGFLLWWERATDVSVVLDRLLVDTLLAPHIDTTRIAAIGFSLGGYTVLSTVGARTDRSRFQSFCASGRRDFTCGPQPEFPDAPRQFAAMVDTDSATRAALSRAGAPHDDSRIRAAVVLAPAVVQALSPSSLAAIRAPLLIIVGDSDHVAPPSTNAQYAASMIPSARLVTIPDGGHYLFLDACTSRGKQLVADACTDAPSIDRAAVHARVVDAIVAFLQEVLVAGRQRSNLR